MDILQIEKKFKNLSNLRKMNKNDLVNHMEVLYNRDAILEQKNIIEELFEYITHLKQKVEECENKYKHLQKHVDKK